MFCEKMMSPFALFWISYRASTSVVIERPAELESTARVFGTIETPALIVKKGAIFEGTTKMGAKVTPISAAAAAVPAPGK